MEGGDLFSALTADDEQSREFSWYNRYEPNQPRALVCVSIILRHAAEILMTILATGCKATMTHMRSRKDDCPLVILGCSSPAAKVKCFTSFTHSLGMHVRRGKSVALDIAVGLRFLHDHNIIHLDLKSPNVLLTGSGQAKLADVGLARTLITNTHLSTLPGGDPLRFLQMKAPSSCLTEPVQHPAVPSSRSCHCLPPAESLSLSGASLYLGATSFFSYRPACTCSTCVHA